MGYLAALWRSPGTVLEELPLQGVTYTRRLGGAASGDLTGRLYLADLRGSAARAADLIAATEPWRTAVYADVDGALRWGGPVVSRPYKSGQGYLEVKAAEPGAYFARNPIPVNRTHVAVEQLAIQRQLYADVLAQPGGDVQVVLGADTSGVTRDRTYLAGQLKSTEEAAKELSNVQNGFDYAWVPEWAGTEPRLRLAQGYPALGHGTEVALAYPGDVLAYGWPEEGGAMATTAVAVGKQDQDTNTTPQAYSTATSLLDAGYPRLVSSQTYNEVSDPATLQAHADADLEAQAGPLVNVELEMRLDVLRGLGIDLGNVVRLTIEDPLRFPSGTVLQLRVVAITERPEAGTAQVVVADRVLIGGRVPSGGGAPELLATLSRRLLAVETV